MYDLFPIFRRFYIFFFFIPDENILFYYYNEFKLSILIKINLIRACDYFSVSELEESNNDHQPLGRAGKIIANKILIQ